MTGCFYVNFAPEACWLVVSPFPSLNSKAGIILYSIAAQIGTEGALFLPCLPFKNLFNISRFNFFLLCSLLQLRTSGICLSILVHDSMFVPCCCSSSSSSSYGPTPTSINKTVHKSLIFSSLRLCHRYLQKW